MSEKPYQYVSSNENPNDVYIKLTSGEFSGIIYSYGKVTFSEGEGEGVARMHFEYNIKESPIEEFDIVAFENYIGDILVGLIQEQIERNEVVYSGGINEGDTLDSILPTEE